MNKIKSISCKPKYRIIRCYYCGDTKICGTCNGDGKQQYYETVGDHQVLVYKTCESCYGSGKCRHCV